MEPAEKYQTRLAELVSAMDGFESLMKVDLSAYDEEIADGLRNGQIQKFEYCVELLGKTAQSYLRKSEGIEVASPKGIAKEFYRLKKINESDFDHWADMIEDRNRLSHVYRKAVFEEIYEKLGPYLKNLRKILDVIEG